MLAWRSLKWWQRSLAAVAVAYFVTMYWIVGAPKYSTISGWLGYVGPMLIIAAMVLNLWAFGRPDAYPSHNGWMSWPLMCKVLGVAGLSAILSSMILHYYGL